MPGLSVTWSCVTRPGRVEGEGGRFWEGVRKEGRGEREGGRETERGVGERALTSVLRHNGTNTIACCAHSHMAEKNEVCEGGLRRCRGLASELP